VLIDEWAGFAARGHLPAQRVYLQSRGTRPSQKGD
jgi:hypothetical protein